jgi:hypothetical protein
MKGNIKSRPTEQVHCMRCGRNLRAAASVAAGFGPGCRARIRAAAMTVAVKDFSQAQVDKARELIADKGIIRTGFAGVFRTVSSDGAAYYLTAASGQCNCRAGLNGRRCYHVAAAVMVQARRAA